MSRSSSKTRDRSDVVRAGSSPESSIRRFREAPTQPSMPVASAAKPLHDTIPEMRGARLQKIKKGLESEHSSERWKFAADLGKMIKATDETNLQELIEVAFDALEGEKNPAVVFALIDCFVHATGKGFPPDSVADRIIESLDGDENIEIRKSTIMYLGTEAFLNGETKSLEYSLLRLLIASTPSDAEFLAKLRSEVESEEKAPSSDGLYMITPESSADFVTRESSDLPQLTKGLASESMLLRKRALKDLLSYVKDADTAREVMSILPSPRTAEAEAVCAHCIERLKPEI